MRTPLASYLIVAAITAAAAAYITAGPPDPGDVAVDPADPGPQLTRERAARIAADVQRRVQPTLNETDATYQIGELEGRGGPWWTSQDFDRLCVEHVLAGYAAAMEDRRRDDSTDDYWRHQHAAASAQNAVALLRAQAAEAEADALAAKLAAVRAILDAPTPGTPGPETP